jgi:hypothetical protein
MRTVVPALTSCPQRGAATRSARLRHGLAGLRERCQSEPSFLRVCWYPFKCKNAQTIVRTCTGDGLTNGMSITRHRRLAGRKMAGPARRARRWTSSHQRGADEDALGPHFRKSGYRLGSSPAPRWLDPQTGHRLAPALHPSIQTWSGDGRWETERYVETEDGSEHPEGEEDLGAAARCGPRCGRHEPRAHFQTEDSVLLLTQGSEHDDRHRAGDPQQPPHLKAG